MDVERALKKWPYPLRLMYYVSSGQEEEALELLRGLAPASVSVTRRDAVRLAELCTDVLRPELAEGGGGD